MRINGFSGMDIDSMVKSLMTARKVPMDKLVQQRTTLQWQRDSYREMNSKFYDFRNNKLDKFRKSTELNTQTAVVTGNTDAVKANATASANGISMKVDVLKLASAATMETEGIGLGYKSTQTLAELARKIPANGDTTAIPDNAKTQEYKITLKDKNGKDLSMTFKGSDTISSVISQINSNADMGVTASFDEVSGKFKITSKTMGNDSSFSNVAVDETPDANGKATLSLLNVFSTNKVDNVTSGTPYKGSNGSISINGSAEIPTSSNTVIYNGVEMTLLQVTKDKPFTISTQTDPQKALDTVKAFIDSYNSLIDTLNTKVGEEKYRDYPPLTDEQRKDMSESDIKLWEEKAKSGLLKNDDILKETITSMRSIITENLGTLSDFGITTGQYFEGGKLKLDETKFKSAIQNNSQLFVETFQGSGSNIKDSVFNRLITTMDDSMDKLSQRAGTTKFSGDLNSIYKEESVMGEQLKGYNQRIAALQVRLNNAEERYYKQFTAMETAMSRYQSQASNLTSYLGSGS